MLALIFFLVAISVISLSYGSEKEELERKKEQKIHEEKERFLRKEPWEKRLVVKEIATNF